MNKLISFFFTLLLLQSSAKGQQIVTINPQFATINSTNVQITFDASKGNAGLLGESVIYAHTGVITSTSTSPGDWRYVIANWTTNLPKAQLTRVGSSSLYTLTLGNIRSFYGIPSTETVLKLAFVFRNADGSKTGKTSSGGDIFVELSQGAFQAKFSYPAKGSFYSQDSLVSMAASSSEPATLKLFADGVLLKTNLNDTVINYSDTFSNLGTSRINLVVEADNGTEKAYDTTYIIRKRGSNIAVAPSGLSDGINYINDSTVILQLFAPYKSYVYVLGDFNNWEYHPDYMMNRTPDGQRYWIMVNGLIKGREYGFQYSIDDIQLRVADVYADKLLDPYNDGSVPAATYPSLKPYPVGKTNEVVSVLQTSQEPYIWQVDSFLKPASEKLVIYELLIRDFVGTHSLATMKDTISYFKRIGVNCIELMPVMEFEGNESWGYNPMFYFAVDKYYGTKNNLKAFVDECHKNGIAVVLDVVLNHSFGQNPQVRMYFDPSAGTGGQPTAQNPWFNQTDRHPYGVGYDYNHESQATQDFVDRVLKYWITEYHADGYRFDLSKGFTQKYTTDVSAWSAYDQSRVNNLNRIRSKIITYAPDAYLILEHLGDNSEEKVLSASGFMLWGKMTDNYAEAMMGYSNTKADLSWSSYKARGFDKPNLVTYAESHDEERVTYSCITYGNSNGSYSTKNLNTALKRVAAYHALLLPLRGPKMIWMGGELGYEISINTNGRMGNKPFKWDYLSVAERKQLLYEVGNLARLKQHVSFTSDNFTYSTAGTIKILRVNHDSMNTVIIANMDVTGSNSAPGFPHTGWWYNYQKGDSLLVVSTAATIQINPGEYFVYTDKNISPVPSGSSGIEEFENNQITVFPNPFSDVLYVSSSKADIDHVEIYDLQGKKVFETYHGQSGIEEIHPGKLNAGVYLIRLYSGRNVFQKKIAVN